MNLNGQARPVKCKLRKLTPEQQHSRQTQVDDLEKAGVFEQVEQVSDEGWISVPVLKARENKPPVIRWCTNFRI